MTVIDLKSFLTLVVLLLINTGAACTLSFQGFYDIKLNSK